MVGFIANFVGFSAV